MLETYARAESFLHEVVKKHAGKTVVICSHAGPILQMQQIL
jgi:broad specificity phosphatase PhoE